MQSLREIKREIGAINSTRKIMLTMKHISSARIRRAQQTMEQGRPFAKKMAVMIDNLKKDIEAVDGPIRNSVAYKFFDTKNAGKGGVFLLLITADKGLCGAFNAVALRQAIKWLRANKDRQKYVFAVGKKGRDFFARLKMPNLEVVGELAGIFPHTKYAHATMVQQALGKLFMSGKITQADLIYNDFKSMAAQTLVSKTFLPFDFEDLPGQQDLSGFIFEPSIKEVFLTLLPRFVGSNIYRFMLESQAAELAARMNAMEAASKNAGDILQHMQVLQNKIRQESITRELTEIIGGAAALNS